MSASGFYSDWSFGRRISSHSDLCSEKALMAMVSDVAM
jgi:hypothetical protein